MHTQKKQEHKKTKNKLTLQYIQRKILIQIEGNYHLKNNEIFATLENNKYTV